MGESVDSVGFLGSKGAGRVVGTLPCALFTGQGRTAVNYEPSINCNAIFGIELAWDNIATEA